MVTGEVKLGEACSLEGNYDKPRKCIIKKQRRHFADKGTYRQSYGFSNNDVWMWELDRKEGWAPKNRCFEIVVLEKTLERPLYCNEIKPVNLKGSQPWTFIRRTDAEASTLWPHNAGKDWGQKEKWVAEDEMIRWHPWLNGHESEQTPGDEWKAVLLCCSPRGRKGGSWLSNWTAAVVQVVVWVVDNIFISSTLFLLKLSQFRMIINNQIDRNWEGVGSWGRDSG